MGELASVMVYPVLTPARESAESMRRSRMSLRGKVAPPLDEVTHPASARVEDVRGKNLGVPESPTIEGAEYAL